MKRTLVPHVFITNFCSDHSESNSLEKSHSDEEAALDPTSKQNRSLCLLLSPGLKKNNKALIVIGRSDSDHENRTSAPGNVFKEESKCSESAYPGNNSGGGTCTHTRTPPSTVLVQTGLPSTAAAEDSHPQPEELRPSGGARHGSPGGDFKLKPSQEGRKNMEDRRTWTFCGRNQRTSHGGRPS